MSSNPPIAARKPSVRSFHGDDFTDYYEWLREKSSPEVVDYLNAEMAYTMEQNAHLEPTVETIFQEIKTRVQETDLSVPQLIKHTDSAFWYYSRTLEGKNYPVFCRLLETDPNASVIPDISQTSADEEILLDCNEAAAGFEFFSIGDFGVSPDGSKVAWQVDNAGDEHFTLHVKDLSSRQMLSDTLDHLGWGLSWASDEWLIYHRFDAAWRPYQIWAHRLGTPADQDILIHQDDNDKTWVECAVSKDYKMIVIEAATKTTGEVWYLPTDEIDGGKLRCLSPRSEDLDYHAFWAGDRFLILHNRDHREYSLSQAWVGCTSHAEWETVIPGEDSVYLSQVLAFKDHVVLGLRRNGLTQVRVISRDREGNLAQAKDLEFDEDVRTVVAMGNPNWDASNIRLHYTSLATPATVLQYRFADGSLTTLKRTPVLDHPVYGPYDPSAYESVREWATAADGTQIPVSLIYRKGLQLDGNNPTLLYAYGSYGSCVDPYFSIARLSLLDRGVVFAIAHVRGGSEMGRHWYENGKFHTKKNTFTDFIDVAKHLIERGYTCPARLAAEGRSAGGMLMGAIVNMAPELFKCVHAGVPFVDSLTSMVKPELPLTTGEWGDPYHNPSDYAYMKSYSPYENVQPGPHPAILATTSFNDTRVLYVEPAKWIAQLRHTIPDNALPFYLHIEMVAGHGGVSGRYDAWRQAAWEYAWMLDQLGVPVQ